MKKITAGFLLFSLFLTSVLLPGTSAENTPIRLTNNDLPDCEHQAYGNRVTWQRGDRLEKMEIFLYDGESVIQVTDNDYGDYRPSIHSGGVTWRSFAGNMFNIFLYKNGVTTQITDNNNYCFDPVIWGDMICWYEMVGSNKEVFWYDGNSVIQITNNDYDDIDPHISDGTISWQTDSGSYRYDKKSLTPYEDNSNEKRCYTLFDGNDSEVYFFDGVETIQITDNDTDDGDAHFYGDTVVWQGYDGHDNEIYMYQNGVVTQITNNDIGDSFPSISSDIIAWCGSESLGNNSEIYVLKYSEQPIPTFFVAIIIAVIIGVYLAAIRVIRKKRK